MSRMRSAFAIGVAVLISASTSVFARGGLAAEDRFDPHHIRDLPAEIQNAVVRMCGGSPKAEHRFAGYFEHSRRIVLHFEHFSCDGSGALCTQAGCLHQVYVSTGGAYRLLRSFYGPDGD
jgi:hypothetical protein